METLGTSYKQRERRQRGNDFQEEIRNSWNRVPNVWQMRIKDGGGGTRPADYITLTEDANILAELKRTAGESFKLSMLEPNQIKGLLDFDGVITRNYGLVFVSFENAKRGLDEAYVFRLVAALRYMRMTEKNSINRELLQRVSRFLKCAVSHGTATETNPVSNAVFRVWEVPRLGSTLYDLREVPGICKYL